MYTHTHTRIHIHTHMYIYIYIYIYTYTYIIIIIVALIKQYETVANSYEESRLAGKQGRVSIIVANEVTLILAKTH